MLNKTKVINPEQEAKIFMKDLVQLMKLIEAESKKISKAKQTIKKQEIEDGIFKTEEGKMLAKDFTATFKAFVNAAKNITIEHKEERKKLQEFYSKSLDFLEKYESMFDLHDEKELLSTFLHHK